MTAAADADSGDGSHLRAAHVADAARGWIGTPWQHGASRRGAGCDCIGLIRGVWREVIGPEPWVLPPYRPDWRAQGEVARLLAGLRAHLRPVPPGGFGPGSVLLFALRPSGPGVHLGVATSADRFVHAYSRHGVVESRLGPAWRCRLRGVFALPQC